MAQPLTREHLNAINETIQIDKTIRPILNRAETAMIDLGDRKELNMAKSDSKLSNRYVLIDGEVAAVDPWSWIRIKKVISEGR